MAGIHNILDCLCFGRCGCRARWTWCCTVGLEWWKGYCDYFCWFRDRSRHFCRVWGNSLLDHQVCCADEEESFEGRIVCFSDLLFHSGGNLDNVYWWVIVIRADKNAANRDATTVYKGAPQLKLNKLPQTTIALAIVLTGVVIAFLSVIFWLPFVYSKVIKKDYSKPSYQLDHASSWPYQLFDGITSFTVLFFGVEPLLLLLPRAHDTSPITEFTIEMTSTKSLPRKPLQTRSLKVRPKVKVLLLKPIWQSHPTRRIRISSLPPCRVFPKVNHMPALWKTLRRTTIKLRERLFYPGTCGFYSDTSYPRCYCMVHRVSCRYSCNWLYS